MPILVSMLESRWINLPIELIREVRLLADGDPAGHVSFQSKAQLGSERPLGHWRGKRPVMVSRQKNAVEAITTDRPRKRVDNLPIALFRACFPDNMQVRIASGERLEFCRAID